MNRQWKLTSAVSLVLAALTGGAHATTTAAPDQRFDQQDHVLCAERRDRGDD